MYHSYEGLDRAGGVSRVRLLAPMRHRPFRLLMYGVAVSLVGDGLFLVALAWQVYALSNAPTALASVGIAMTVPTIVCLLLGGAASDRFSRTRVMLSADTVRAVALAALAVLSLSGALVLWQLLVIAVVYGAATAFFAPASDALIPEILPADLLAQANALDQLVRPLALRLAGPALGGIIVAAVGSGGAFAIDSASFFISAVSMVAIGGAIREGSCGSAPTAASPAPAEPGALRREVAAGLRYVRSQPWLWATLVSAALAYLLFMGPTEVLLPYVVKNQLRLGAGALGIVFAAGGMGSLLCAILIGQQGLPRRTITFMYVTWSIATLSVAGYGLARGLWGLVVASVLFNALETAGTIAWATVKQRHVPADLLGRVSSLDWLISIGLLPVSYALTGPIGQALGVRATLGMAGVLGAIVTIAALFVPGMRDVEEGGSGVLFEALPDGELPPLRLASSLAGR